MVATLHTAKKAAASGAVSVLNTNARLASFDVRVCVSLRDQPSAIEVHVEKPGCDFRSIIVSSRLVLVCEHHQFVYHSYGFSLPQQSWVRFASYSC